MFRTRVIFEVLTIVISTLGVSCDLMSATGPLATPDPARANEIGRAALGLPLAITVPSGIHVAARIPLELKVTNVTNHPWDYNPLAFNAARFGIWVFRDRQESKLTEEGEKYVPRQTVWMDAGGSAIPAQIPPGESRTLNLDQAGLFEIHKPGHYTVVVEDGPFMTGDDDQQRELLAAKTSFDILR